MIVAAIDEVNKGEALGPIYVGICWTSFDLKENLGESKKYSKKFFENLYENLKSLKVDYLVKTISVKAIDTHNINELLTKTIKELVQETKVFIDQLYVDSYHIKCETLHKALKHLAPKVVVKHKGDSLYPLVGLASLIALKKKTQDFQLYRSLYGPIGSGNLADKNTKRYILLNPNSPILRKKWSLKTLV